MLKMLRNKKAQSTVEYVILVAIVIAAILTFSSGIFKPAFSNTLQQGTNGMLTMANRLANSRP